MEVEKENPFGESSDEAMHNKVMAAMETVSTRVGDLAFVFPLWVFWIAIFLILEITEKKLRNKKIWMKTHFGPFKFLNVSF